MVAVVVVESEVVVVESVVVVVVDSVVVVDPVIKEVLSLESERDTDGAPVELP